MDEEKVSIIIPIYNMEKYLEKCIESIINQSYSNLEIILVNDGSKDDSLKICEKYRKIDKRVKVIDKQNGGVSSARNIGLNNSTGEWINFMDPDDWAEKDMIEFLITNAKKNNAEIVQGNCYYNIGNKQKERKAINPNLIIRDKDKIELFQLDIISTIYEERDNNVSLGPIRGVWGKLYKKEVLDNLRFNNELYAFEDGVFNLYAFEKANRIILTNKYLYHYRKNLKSACNAYKSSWLTQIKQILVEVDKFVREKDKDVFYEVYNLLTCEMFTSSLTRSIFHKDNGKTITEEKKILKEYINSEIFQNAFSNVNFKYLNKKQKLIIFLAKKGWINCIIYIYIIKNILNK